VGGAAAEHGDRLGSGGNRHYTTFAKVLDSLPTARRVRFEQVLERVVVGIPPSEIALASAGPIEQDVYSACKEAFLSGSTLRLDYVDRHGKTSERVVAPHGLLVQPPLWYLLTFDEKQKAGRTFRLDRIRLASVDPVMRFEPHGPRELFSEIEQYGIEAKR
jgi:predicted DNA-binding transcriptional regulator YafY